ncbi:uncharacterized protein EAE97_007386 [Botrytis byssoidea]|uniref:Uncharacterized protein n=1 Tax=Botrytis byssoidea TaxID=139641 RepID=A0A9P5IJ78_9HELO|nr:uncharacterized protein EAE97_007386 [Botrytis byssoidea]KAF7939306.1 hypothetical protein EAE97_007386 [Botrytis byssoidea]
MLLSPTLYQKKYGVPPTPIAIIIGSHRSGLTPISAYDLTNPSANASREERTAYRQSRLCGYTSQLLVDLDVVSLRSLTIPEDSNPINPTMQRSRWFETSDLVLPISSSEAEGISWTAQNPLIWKHLQLYLKLASRLLTRMHLDPFVQALLLGNTETIPIEEFKSQDVFRFGPGIQKLFKRFDPLAYDSKNAFRTRQELNRIGKKILMRHYTLGFGVDEPAKSQGDEGMESSAPLKQSFVAVSTYNRQNMTIVTKYNVYSFRVLTNPNLSNAERLSEEWYVATSMYHEFMHVLGYAKESTSDGDSLKEEIKEAVSHGALYEPMWRREQKSELGWAGEASMFGGTHSKILYNKITNGPGLGSTLDPWPEYDAAKHGDTPQLLLPLGSRWASPLPIYMHTQFRSEDFWSLYARKYELFHPVNSIGYAHAITIEDDYAKEIDYQYNVVLPSDFNGYLSPVSVITPTLHGVSKPSECTYAEYLLLNRDGRMDKAKTLRSRLERFRDLFHEINATMHQQSKTLMDYAWLYAYFEEPPEPEYEEAEYENGFEKWLDKWTESLNKLTEALDACLQNFDISIHRLTVWETAIKSSLYSDRYHEEEINQCINLKNFGVNLLELIESLKFIEGENDRNLQRYYNDSVDTYWASRRRLSPECNYATVIADNASSAQKNKAVFEAKLQRARAPLAYMDIASFEPLCNQLLHDDLGAALKPALRAELFTLLTKCTSFHTGKLTEYARGARKALLWLTRDPTASDEEKQSALDKWDELQEYINEAKNL